MTESRSGLQLSVRGSTTLLGRTSKGGGALLRGYLPLCVVVPRDSVRVIGVGGALQTSIATSANAERVSISCLDVLGFGGLMEVGCRSTEGERWRRLVCGIEVGDEGGDLFRVVEELIY